jgi:hypothetical protein
MSSTQKITGIHYTRNQTKPKFQGMTEKEEARIATKFADCDGTDDHLTRNQYSSPQIVSGGPN